METDISKPPSAKGGHLQLPLFSDSRRQQIKKALGEVTEFAGRLFFYFIAKIKFIVRSVRFIVNFTRSQLSNLKFEIVRKLIWSRGRLFRPISHLAVLSLTSVTFLTGGLFSGTSLVSGKSPNPDVLSAQSDLLAENVSLKTETPSNRGREEPLEYVVKEGDTLSSIGEKFKVSVDTIRFANNIVDIDYLKVGQTLAILPVSGVEHSVESGETVEGIAKKYAISPQAIVDFNYLSDPFTLEVGQKLIIPEAKIPEPEPEPAPSSYVYVPSTAEVSVSGTGQFRWPTNTRYISQYFSYYHPAIDIAKFSPIYAADSGKVVRAGWWPGGYGLAVQIDHGNGFTTTYAHLSRIDVFVGQNVGKEEVIGMMGNTGRSWGTHLHFVVQRYGQYLNPLSVL